MADRNAIPSQARQIAVTDPCCCACYFLKKREEDVMYDALFAPLSNYRESQQAYKTLSCIKTEPEEIVLAPLKPRSDGMEPSDFGKCEICINCKITHKQDTKLYIIKKIFLMLGFEPLFLHYSSK